MALLLRRLSGPIRNADLSFMLKIDAKLVGSAVRATTDIIYARIKDRIRYFFVFSFNSILTSQLRSLNHPAWINGANLHEWAQTVSQFINIPTIVGAVDGKVRLKLIN